MNVREEVACPACGEMILAVANKCKHCGERFIQDAGQSEPQPIENIPEIIGTREVIFSMSRASVVKVGKFSLFTQDGTLLGEVGFRLPSLVTSLHPGVHNLSLRNAFGSVPVRVDISNESSPLRVSFLPGYPEMQATYDESTDDVQKNQSGIRQALWKGLGAVVICCITILYLVTNSNSFSVGKSRIQATCKPKSITSIGGSCKIISIEDGSAKSLTVRAHFSGTNPYWSEWAPEWTIKFSCKAWNESGIVIGESYHNYSIGRNYNFDGSDLRINPSESVKSISCTWQL